MNDIIIKGDKEKTQLTRDKNSYRRDRKAVHLESGG